MRGGGGAQLWMGFLGGGGAFFNDLLVVNVLFPLLCVEGYLLV